MHKVILVIKILAAMLPTLIELIKQAEALFPEAGAGQQKLEMIRNAIEAAFQSFTEAELRFAEAWPSINTMITSIVAIYNARGIFRKGGGGISDQPAG